VRRGASSHIAVIFAAMVPLVCLALLPGHAQADPASCGARAGANDSSSAEQGMASSAHITLSIDHGASGTTISVTGTSWPANAQIIIDFVDTGEQNLGRPGIAQAKTGATGAFHSSEFLAPMAICGVSPSAGTVSFVVAHTADGSVKAQARFTFVTSPELATTHPYADSLSVQGANIQVSGRSWGPGTLVTLYATQQQTAERSISFSRIANTPSIQVHADATGAFQATVSLPAGLPPAIYVSVAATATSPLYGSLVRDLRMMFLVTPEMYPSVALSSDVIARGDILTITGEHWRSGDTVSVEACLGAPQPDKQGIMSCGPYLAGGGPTLLAKVTVSLDGGFVVKAQVPRQARVGMTGVHIYANDASLQWYDVTLGIRVLDAQIDNGASNSGSTTLALGAIALLLCLGLGASVFVWRRRQGHMSAIHTSLGSAARSGDNNDE
jgi:hypothetical protein